MAKNNRIQYNVVKIYFCHKDEHGLVISIKYNHTRYTVIICKMVLAVAILETILNCNANAIRLHKFLPPKGAKRL